MKNFLYYVAAVTLLFTMSLPSKAGTKDELRELLDGKQIVYDGVCWFDAKNVITFKQESKKSVKRCVVGMELPDQSKHYILLINKNGATELLVYDEKTKQQKLLWWNGHEA
jgi:hypothetical protein